MPRARQTRVSGAAAARSAAAADRAAAESPRPARAPVRPPGGTPPASPLRALPDPHTGSPSRFPLVTCDEAWATLTAFRPVATERIRVPEAAGRVLARDLRATIDLPHFTRSYMDGYAVRAADTAGASAERPVRLRVTGTVAMGRPAAGRVDAGTAHRIPTGGMLPRGADAIVMVEHTTESSDGVVEIRHAARAGEHVMRRGEDVHRGDLLYRRGRRFRAQDVGALSGAGITSVEVYRKPRVALIATGDEIVPPEQRPKPGQVRNINHHAVRAMIAAEGGITVDFGVVPDQRPRIERALRRALRDADMVLISGGSSVGTKDLTPIVIQSAPRSAILVHGIRIKPGKPTLIARAAGKPIIGLPGHPVSALVIFDIFAVPLLRRLAGEPAAASLAPRRRAVARLAEPITSIAGRDDFARVTLEWGDAELVATPLAGGSAEIFSLVHADGLVHVPRDATALPAGAAVEVRLFA